jgi:hypothetical protein
MVAGVTLDYHENMKTQTLFSIHLFEDDNGLVKVVCEAAGEGVNAYEIGIEVMANLKVAAHNWPERLAVQPLTFSSHWQ